MGETSEFDIIVPGSKGIPIYIKDRQVLLNADTTTIWRYGPEDSHLNHFVIEIDGEPQPVFGLDEELEQELSDSLGCPVVDTSQTPDADTRAAYNQWVNGGLEDFHQAG